MAVERLRMTWYVFGKHLTIWAAYDTLSNHPARMGKSDSWAPWE